MLLETSDLESRYGRLPAISGINLTVAPGEIVAVIGSNGAGKSTLLKTVSGHLYPAKGRVSFAAQDVTFMPAWKRLELGMAFVPEGRRLFGGLSVHENLFLGSFPLRKTIRHGQLETRLAFLYDLFPVLKSRGRQIALTLSGGEQQMLAIARGLVSDPKLLVVDELSLGLAPLIKRDIYRTLARLHENGQLSVLVVEQDVEEVLRISNRGYLLQTGRLVLEESSQVLASDPTVKDIYLGNA